MSKKRRRKAPARTRTLRKRTRARAKARVTVTVTVKAKTKAKPTRARKRPAPRLPLQEASARTRARVFRDIHRVLEAHGVAGNVAEVHLDAVTASARAAPCPPNTIRRLVCSRQDDGTMHCEEQCVPI